MTTPTRRPPKAEDRLRRLLVMLPWLMEVEHVPLAEVASRFAMSEPEVVRDLELVAMCGLPPYVDEMIDVFVDDGIVHVGVPRLFRRSLRLTAPEAFSLLAAARTAEELPGADAGGALQRGLDRVTAALRDAGVLGDAAVDGDGDPTTGVEIDLDRPPLADLVATAVADGAQLRIDYFSPTRDEVTRRVVVPRHVFVDRGNWYLRADDEASGEARTFRIDRIESAEPTGVTVPVDPALAEPAEFFTDRDVPRVRLRVTPRAAWILDRYPHDSAEPVTGRSVPPGSIEVELPVASEQSLARLLVRLGPDATVVDPRGAGDLAADLAERMLSRYR